MVSLFVATGAEILIEDFVQIGEGVYRQGIPSNLRYSFFLSTFWLLKSALESFYQFQMSVRVAW